MQADMIYICIHLYWLIYLYMHFNSRYIYM